LLSSYTSAGRLYEIDLRLRPNGASGLLVSSIPAFAEYQQQHAWVWEHQALTRARFCAGDEQVGKQFEIIRNNVLCKPRDLNVLRQEIVAMRQKMLDTHPNDSDLFDTLRAIQHKMRLNSQSPCRVDRKAIDITSVITLWEELLGPHGQEKK
jgi:glutamate-ammonia-ligase adenylyltransferase